MALIRAKLATLGKDYQAGLTGRIALAYDTFDGAANAEVATIGNGGIWFAPNSSWRYTGDGAIRCATNAGSPTNNNFLWCPTTSANVIVSTRCTAETTTDDPAFGVTFNTADAGNNWRAVLMYGGTHVRYRLRYFEGSEQVSNYDVTIFEPYTSSDVFSVRVEGDSLTVLKNDRVNSAVFTQTDRRFKTITQHGLASNFNTVANRDEDATRAFEFSVESL